MASPALDDGPGLLERVEDFAIQKLIAQLRVEALAIAVLPWATGQEVDEESCTDPPLASAEETLFYKRETVSDILPEEYHSFVLASLNAKSLGY